MTIRAGLVSVTFRHASVEDVIAYAIRAGLTGIEWGGDVHVPHGNVSVARRVAEMTRYAGLAIAAYGSYYYLAHSRRLGLDPKRVVETAAILGADTIRVWAGHVGSAQADAAYWSAVVADARDMAALAADRGMTISFEYHSGTLTDSRSATRRLLDLLPGETIRTLWQPQPARSLATNLEDLLDVLPRLSNIHVCASTRSGERLPLSHRRGSWKAYLGAADGTSRDRHALLEFVIGNDPEQLVSDALTLNHLISSCNL